MTDELVDVVDEHDNVIGQDYRRNKMARGFISRNVSIFVRDKNGLYVTFKRAPHKTVDPGCFDTICGAVLAGEDYETAGHRELLEEAGTTAHIVRLAKRYNEHPGTDGIHRWQTAILLATIEGSVVLNDEHTEYQTHPLSVLKTDLIARPHVYTHALQYEFADAEALLPK